MSDQFVGEIRIMPYKFVPMDWAACDGQLLPTSQNAALFAVLRAVYGGNGTTTFALPDLRERVPIGAGQLSPGPSQPSYKLGQQGGTGAVQLNANTMAAHSHPIGVDATFGNSNDPTGRVLARPFGGGNLFRNGGTTVQLGTGPLPAAGGTAPPLNVQAHSNIMPSLSVQFCIALRGATPQRP